MSIKQQSAAFGAMLWGRRDGEEWGSGEMLQEDFVAFAPIAILSLSSEYGCGYPEVYIQLVTRNLKNIEPK